MLFCAMEIVRINYENLPSNGADMNRWMSIAAQYTSRDPDLLHVFFFRFSFGPGGMVAGLTASIFEKDEVNQKLILIGEFRNPNSYAGASSSSYICPDGTLLLDPEEDDDQLGFEYNLNFSFLS